ncbi:MAG: glycosyltransferase family 9 protein [Acidobacteria bacterium]|nr:glycosyltransferase family 9 protein [Acidobacteriota bacterium]
MMIHYDCRYFLGHKPCRFRRDCDGCPHYSVFGKRILIIKLAALGDVLRTTPLLRGLHAGSPDCHITWLTESNVIPMLQGIREIDRLMPYAYETALQLEMETFNELYCFDKEPKATALAMKIHAERKVGFGLSRMGNVIPLNREAEYTYRLGISDNLKFRTNQKTYPELIFECAAIPCPEPQEYILPDLTSEIEEAGTRLLEWGIRPEDLKIGFNTGSGEVFATKKWTEEGYIRLADRLSKELGAKILLLGGPGEVERNRRIAAGTQCPVINTGNDNPIRKFAGIVGNCSLMITGDTLAMHIAIGLKVPVVVILGSTCHQEIELYGRGAKIVSDFECSPCYLSACPKQVSCMDAISPDEVFAAAANLLRRR